MSQDSNQTPIDPTSSSAESGERKIIFAPGCFDNFEGTQEELQDLIAEIQRLVATGEIHDKAVPMSDEAAEELFNTPRRTRQ